MEGDRERFVTRYPPWFWDEESNDNSEIVIDYEKKVATFFPFLSNGTNSVVGDTPFVPGFIYYWEIQMMSSVGGTDTMIGVGKKNADKFSNEFMTLLGKDANSWGFSYTGLVWHDGKYEEYKSGFNTNDRVGCLCEPGRGILEFFKNGKSLGIAFKSVSFPELYPMVSTSNSKTSIKLLETHQLKSGLWSDAFTKLVWHEKGRKMIESIPLFKNYPAQYWFLGERLPVNDSLYYEDKNEHAIFSPAGHKFRFVRAPSPPLPPIPSVITID